MTASPGTASGTLVPLSYAALAAAFRFPPDDDGAVEGVLLGDAEAEAAETQVWLEFSIQCGYLEAERGDELSTSYDNILGKIVSLINNPQP